MNYENYKNSERKVKFFVKFHSFQLIIWKD